MKKHIYHLLNDSGKPGDAPWLLDIFLVTLISLNIAAVILESVEALRLKFEMAFLYFEIFSVAVFTVEYLLRLWTANEDPRYKKRLVGNLRFAITPMAIIDLLAFLPFYFPFWGVDTRFLRMLRLFRIFRLFKIARYLTALTLINRVITNKREELAISLMLTVFLLILTSTLMYYVENEAQPQNFSSIPQTMWWGIATLTTVGYGDVYPVTALGRALGGVIALIGVGLFALPTGILASGFSEELSRKKGSSNICPTCGQEIRDQP